MDFVRNAIQTVTVCCMNCHEEESVGVEPTERTQLLQEQQRRNFSSQIFNRNEIEIEDNDYSSSVPKRDEQTALSRIVAETNANIIDVAALDTHILEQSEYNDRVKTYAQRLSHQWNSVGINDTRYNGMLKDIPHPENHLATFPNADDVAMIKSLTKDASHALNEIKVDNNDELVVPFVIA